ncbi:MAG: membrane protein insertase YidC [Halobacteriovoraceae bacterium]|nr:membrane protein insertase YidC [Halobacteriovoraceae bacterium]
MNDEQKRLFIAVVLSGIVLVSWEMFLRPKIMPDPVQVETSKNSEQTTTQESVKTIENVQLKTEQEKVNQIKMDESTFVIKNKEVSYTLTNTLKIIDIKANSAVFPFEEIVGKDPLSLQFEGDNGKFSSVLFSVEKISDENFNLSNNNGINIELVLDKDNLLNLKINSQLPRRYSLNFLTEDKKLENKQIKKFKFFSSDVDSYDIGKDFVEEAKFLWAGIDFNYHLFAAVLPKGKISKIISNKVGEKSSKYEVKNIDAQNEFLFKIVFTKKNYDNLHSIGSNLDKSVDFGILGLIAVPILRGLQFFYKYIQNYGLAIILVTLIVRLLTFPLQYKSFKSMKAMQKIQPDLQRIKEKFKNDPQRVQRETMELFKKTGANPIGGCLPLILQMPVFFAFYKVLYAAVELVGAPFIFWIHDLSIKDPYYILPVLMGIAFFVQQRVTPSTTTDPTQKKIMMFMPIIFCFFMVNLPAGLVLYIFVSTLFGIAQQMIVYRVID